MAFNPFNIFRRNQKLIFAVLTVIIMFMFTLSSGLSGGADFFEWFPSWLGGRGQRGPTVCEIAGDKVTEGDLSRINRQRVIANQYMTYAAAQAQENVRRSVAEMLQSGAVSAENRPLFRDALEMEANGFIDRQLLMMALQFGMNPQEMIERSVGTLRTRLQAVLTAKAAKSEDQVAARQMLLLVALHQQRLGAPQDLYFVNAANRDARDRVEFLLWLKMADKLGIEFNADAVKKLNDREFMDALPNDAPVLKAMRNVAGFSVTALARALADEYRVRAAQTAVLGPVMERADRTLSAPPVFTTPYELFEFYRDKVSPVTYAAISVPAANFVDQVKGEPTPAQLQDLFNAHKSDEPNPALERPGFKEPRKAKIEWVGATGKEPFYQAGAKEWLAKGEVQAKLGGLLAVPFGPAGPAWAAAAAAPLTLADPLLQSGYQNRTVDRHTQNVRLNWNSNSYYFEVLDTSVVKAGNLASVAGGVAGSLLTLGTPITPAALFNQSVVAHERRARVVAGMPAFFGAVPGPGMLATALAGAAAEQASIPKPLPLDVVKPELQTELTEQMVRKFVVADLRHFQAEVEKLSAAARKDKGAVRAYIDEFLKPRGIRHAGPTEFRDEWTVDDEPALAPLKAAMGKDAHQMVRAPIQFGRKFFYDDRARGPATGVYKPEFYPNEPNPDMPNPLAAKSEEPVYVVWRTDEKAAEEVAFRSAEAKVREAWKRLEARKLAKEEAERLAKEIRESGANTGFAVEMQMRDMQAKLQDRFADPKARDRVKFFMLPNVAPLALTPDLTGREPAGTLQPFQLAPSANIPYPTADMQKALLDDRTNPVKHTVILPPAKPDDPAGKKKSYPPDVYYVTAIVDKSEKSPGDFGGQVYAADRGQARGMVMQSQQMEVARKTREATLALLKAEFKYAKEDTAWLDTSEKRGSD